MAGFLRRLSRSKLLTALRFRFRRRRLQQRFRRTLIEVLDRRDLLAGIPAPLSICPSLSDVEHIAIAFPSSSQSEAVGFDHLTSPVGTSERFVMRFAGSEEDIGFYDTLGGSFSSNSVPVAVNDSFNVFSGLEFGDSVIVNDYDLDGDSLTAILDYDDLHGSFSLDSNGIFTYTPLSDFEGNAYFTYYLNDGNDDSNIATVTFHVQRPNNAPIANDDSFTVLIGTNLSDSVLTNDYDDGESLTVSLGSNVSNGTLSLNVDGSFSYMPNFGFEGYDSFVYFLSDGVNTGSATATLRVRPFNLPPIASHDSFTIFVNSELYASVLTNDYDEDGNSLTVTQVGNASYGSIILAADGTFLYTPGQDFDGYDSFTYVLNDGLVDSNVATVTIRVRPLNYAPVANDDFFTLLVNSSFDGTVRTNDYDEDGNSLTVTQVGNVSYGSISLSEDGTFYTPQVKTLKATIRLLTFSMTA